MKTAIKTVMLAVAGLVFAACGSPASQVVGHYNSSGKMTIDSPSENFHNVITVDGTGDVFEGTTSDLVLVVYSDCMVRLTMDDFDSATVIGETECIREFPDEKITETFNSGSIEFSGAIATVTLEADFVDVYEGKTHVGTSKYDLTMTKLTK